MTDINSNTSTDQSESRDTGSRDWREEMRQARRLRREERHARWEGCGPARGLFWGLLLILLGLLSIPAINHGLSGDEWAAIFLGGLGIIFIVTGLMHNLWQGYHLFGMRIFIGALLVTAAVLLAFGFTSWWPAILLVAGTVILLRPLFLRA